MVIGSRYDSGPLHFSDPARTCPAVPGHNPLTTEYRDGPAVISIGPHQLTSRVILAPMAGVTDRPFRRMCRELGAGLVVSEMVTSDTRLWHSRKSRQRLDHSGEPGPRSRSEERRVGKESRSRTCAEHQEIKAKDSCNAVIE